MLNRKSIYLHIKKTFIFGFKKSITYKTWGPIGPHGGAMGGDIIFDKPKGCGGESLRRIFRLDFWIFEFFVKSIFEEMTKIAQNHF